MNVTVNGHTYTITNESELLLFVMVLGWFRSHTMR